ncbi:sigma-E factor negative regulatory protein [Nitrococcus mobilis]|uniref:Anti sigma-E protein RseA-like n=1 Tax=Nitrococcus mobilis Nb-231 TaxID=314278 RepID=A4BRY9_9GAMM|nr:sigma-E factor negative regulatory protein [Nitrococcus mobilis]EAR21468.1 Anti sigma-E protein RseA-like [Nitrococcus mobilis Nb-231]
MRDGLNEQLSALVDGELRKGETDLLLRQLGRSAELKARFARYCLISDALQRNLSVATGSDLPTRVARALEDEPSYGAEQHRHTRGPRGRLLLRPVAGMALAITGALAMVTMWPQQSQKTASVQAEGERPIVAVQETPLQSRLRPIEATVASEHAVPSVAVETAARSQLQWKRLDPQLQQQLTDYLIKHSERSATGQMDAALPYMRIIGYEAGE